MILKAEFEDSRWIKLIISLNSVRLPSAKNLNILLSKIILMDILCGVFAKAVVGVLGVIKASEMQTGLKTVNNAARAFLKKWPITETKE